MNEDDSVHVFLAKVSGRSTGKTAWVDEEIAKAWVRQHVQSDAEWDFEDGETRVWCSESQVSGSIERVEIKDALALVSQNPLKA